LLTTRQLRWRLTSALYGYAVTRWIMPIGRTLTYGAQDFFDRIVRRELPWYLPPRRLHFIGGGGFLEQGRIFATLFASLGGLRPDEDVLDIGCGIGRMALPLIEFLEPRSHYEGFDVSTPGIEWCQREITQRHPNFRFRTADLRNQRYNPRGTVSAAEYRFPYDDESFDFAISTSVFTHLRPVEIENYLREANRVLRPGGRLFGTWYLLGGQRPRASGVGGNEAAWFPVEVGSCRAVSQRVPEFAVALEEHLVLDRLHKAGFGDVAVEYGDWLGAGGPTWQDVVVATKAPSAATAGVNRGRGPDC